MVRAVDAAKLRTWRKRLSRFVAGEWTVAEFCGREGVTAASFYYWRRRLHDDDPADLPQTVPAVSEARSFLPVEVLVEPKLEVELPNGVVLRCSLERGGSWRQVLEAVSQLPECGEADRC
jgi:transposase-like protein